MTNYLRKDIDRVIRFNPEYAELLWYWWIFNTWEGKAYLLQETVGKQIVELHESIKDLRKEIKSMRIEEIRLC